MKFDLIFKFHGQIFIMKNYNPYDLFHSCPKYDDDDDVFDMLFTHIHKLNSYDSFEFN